MGRDKIDFLMRLTQSDRQLLDSMSQHKTGYTRRDILKLAMVTGVSLTAAEHLLFHAKEASADTPKKGGTIRYASHLHGPDDTLDPARFTSSIDYTRGRATYNGLMQLDENLVPNPELATSAESNSDATEWTFKIREGVEFHDGSKLTADDVVYSMRRHMGEDSVSTVKSVLASVEEWKKTGPYEVKAIMNTPNADLPVLLGLFQTKIIKNGTTGDGIGTGPFTLESFEPGVKSLHVRNENYWRDPANLDAIEVTAITDPVSRVNALLAGDVNLIGNVDAKAFRQIESSDNARLMSIPTALQISICCLKSVAPGSNDDFVKGLQFIQDRQRIVDRILKGKGSIGNDQPITAAHGSDFCSDLPIREYDPDQAKFHFKKSGLSSAELFVAPVQTGIEEMCLLAQANCAKIGFDLKLKKVPTDGYWGAVWMKEPLNVVTWNMRPTANSQLAIQFAPQAAWNDTHWHDDQMGELLKLSLSETDDAKRHQHYCDMQTLVHNNSGIVTPAHPNQTDAMANNIMGIPEVPLGQVGASEWPEFCWIA